MADSELQMQVEQQQMMINQLKELIRLRDSDLDKKEKDALWDILLGIVLYFQKPNTVSKFESFVIHTLTRLYILGN